MTKESMMESLKGLAKSQGFYSNIYQQLIETPSKQDVLYNYAQENGCNDIVDLVMLLEE